MAKFNARYKCLNCGRGQCETVELDVETAAEAMDLYITAKYKGGFVREPAIRNLEPVKTCPFCNDYAGPGFHEAGLAPVVAFTKVR